MQRCLLTMALLLIGAAVRGEPVPTPANVDAQPKSTAEEIPNPAGAAEVPFSAELMNTPDWDQVPQATDRWRVDFAYIPTTIYWDNEDMGDAVRLNVAHEEPDGYGRRGRLWFFNQDLGFSSELYATTFQYDFYRNVRIGRGDIQYGGGPMLGFTDETTRHHHRDQAFYGAGVDAFIGGFYPLLRYERTDFGPVGYGRLAILGGAWDNHGSIQVNKDSFPIIDEFAWGLEMRRRLGAHQEKTFYLDITRELQDWGTPSLPYVADLSIQGFAINFGLMW